MDTLVELLVLLALARVLGEAAARLGQPASVGEIAAGVLIAALAGWSAGAWPWLDRLVASDAVGHAAEVGIFALVLLAGVELEPRQIRRSLGRGLFVAAGGIALPLAAGMALAWWFLPETPLKTGQVLLVGVAMSISAIPATVKIFGELGVLRTRLGEVVIAAAIIDDVAGLVLLAVLLAVVRTGAVPDPWALALLLGKVAAFFLVTGALGAQVYPRVRRGLKVMQAAAMEFSALVAVGLAYGALAELLGMHWVMGAFMAGLFFERARVGRRAYTEMRVILTAVTGGVLGPVFFASIGLRVDLAAVTAVPLFVALLIAVAFLGKLFGAGLPARWSGMDRRDALAVGAGLSARGAVEMVVISIAYAAGLFPAAGAAGGDSTDAHLFSALILMAAVTTMLAPIVLRRVLRGRDDAPPDRSAGG